MIKDGLFGLEMNFLLVTLVSAAIVCVLSASDLNQNIPEYDQMQDLDATGVSCGGVCRASKLRVTVYCCYQNTYRFIFSKRRVRACLRMRAVANTNTTRLALTLNHKTVFNRVVSMAGKEKKVCRRMPGVGRYYAKSHVCLEVDFVDFKKRVVCAKLYGKIRIGWKQFPVDHDFSCFKLPSPSDAETALDLLETNNIDTEPSTEEFNPGNLDLDEGDLDEYDNAQFDEPNVTDDDQGVFLI